MTLRAVDPDLVQWNQWGPYRSNDWEWCDGPDFHNLRAHHSALSSMYCQCLEFQLSEQFRLYFSWYKYSSSPADMSWFVALMGNSNTFHLLICVRATFRFLVVYHRRCRKITGSNAEWWKMKDNVVSCKDSSPVNKNAVQRVVGQHHHFLSLMMVLPFWFAQNLSLLP